MRTYSVRLSRRDGGWDAGIEDIGTIRVERLTGVEAAVRAHLALLAFGDAATARIGLDFGPQLGREVRAVRDARQAAEVASRIAAERSRELAARLIGQGLLGAEVALVLGVSPQRVSQLLAAHPDPVAAAAGAADQPKKRAKKSSKPAKAARAGSAAESDGFVLEKVKAKRRAGKAKADKDAKAGKDKSAKRGKPKRDKPDTAGVEAAAIE